MYKCNNNDCMKLKYQYHSCRNRHCPACGSMQKEQCLPVGRLGLMIGEVSYYRLATTI
ncbi:MAG: transposase zinc-binding domain-containing protein [Saprospiraceae bacterium]|nr:transposase zinc-binding domain-containing protein [Saprospiraceae bacterium]